MCGRLNCYCKYSSYSDRLSKKLDGNTPEWVDPEKFRPSPNIAPTLYVPVLHYDGKKLIMRPMKWGISRLPHVSSLVHNVRFETLSSSTFFQNLVPKQTCAIICDGFYEWKGKKPFFFYDNQTGFDESKVTEWSEEDWTENGPPVMALAGVYHKDNSNYTCSVITREATETNAVHHRITILLSTKEEMLNWLSSELPSSKLSQLKALDNGTLSYYEVNDRVNSSKYQGNDCHVPKSKSSGPLDQWFSRSKDATSIEDTSDNCSSLKRKTSTNSSPAKKKKPPQQKNSGPNSSSGPLDRWFLKTKKPQ